jgi:shikimate dehydrogenase
MADKTVLGVLGYPIGHTLSPLMHTTAAQYHSLDLTYLAFSVVPADLPAALAGVKALGFRGLNLTIPHKEAAIQLVDELTEEARLIRAVNTIVLTENKLIGDNTDGRGFIMSLEKDVGERVKDKNILLLGAGGSARAIAVHLALAGAGKIVIANRTLSRAQELVSYLHDAFPSLVIQALPLKYEMLTPYLEEAEIIINTTSVGMKPTDDLIVPAECLKPYHLVCDIVYRPLHTPLLQAARARGARTLGGLGMLIYQGALSFSLWTGLDMPVELVRRRLLEILTAE